MKNSILFAVLVSISACSSTGLISNDDQEIKKYAARRDTEKLVEIAEQDNKRNRILAMEALGQMRDPRAIPVISKGLQSDSWVVRETAVKALGNIKDYMSLKPLIDGLGDEDKFVREAALKGLRRTVASMARSKDLRFYKPLLGALPDGDNATREGVYDGLQLGVNTLKRFQDTNLFKPLFNALEDDNLYVKEAAARLLGDIKSAAVVSPLIEAQDDNRKFVRDAAAESLQRISDSRAIPPLLKALSSDNDEIRDEAVKVLQKFTDWESVTQIISALEDGDPLVRVGAAKVLGDIGEGRAVKSLIPLLKDSNSDVRYAAAKALEQVSWTPENDDEKAQYCVASQLWDQCVVLGETAIPYLLLALADEKRMVRSKASNALMLMQWQPGNDEAAGRFCATQGDWEKCVQLGEAAVPFIADELRNSETDQKVAAADTLGKIGLPLCIEPLTRALQDPDQTVRIAAVKGLGHIKDMQAVRALVEALDNSNRSVRLESAQVLAEQIDTYRNFETDSLVSLLLTTLQDNNRSVRQTAARLLGELKDPRATIPLIKSLEDPEYEVREEASVALRNIKDPQAIEPLVKALNSKNPEVRAHVVKTLGEFKDHRAIEPLMGTLQDPDSGVRAAAIEVLGTIKDPRAVQPIIKALNDYDDKVRVQAVTVLASSNNPQVIPPLLDKLSDPVLQVREAAGQALISLHWKPSSDDDKAKNCLIRRDWARCIELGKAATVTLVTELNQGDSTIKIPVARTLGEIKDPGAVEALIAYMDSAEKILDRESRLEIYEVTTTALIDIGQPSIGYLIPKLTDWRISSNVARVLKTLQWTPRSDEELVHFLVALREKQSIMANWGLVRKILTKDLRAKDPITIENALYAFIGIGRQEVIGDLIAALNEKGSLPIAEAYLNCGQGRLVDAAEIWAMNNGHKVQQYKKGSQPVQWGQL